MARMAEAAYQAFGGIRILVRAALFAGCIFVVLLFSTGFALAGQALATAILYSLLFASILRISQDTVMAVSVIFLRLAVVLVNALYIQPFFEATTGTDAQLYHEAGLQISHSMFFSGVVSGTGEVWGTNTYAIFTGLFYTLCGASPLRIMIFNSMIAGISSLLFYHAFVDNYPRPHWGMKYLLLFAPSILFWSSIHGKDPVVFFFLGLLFWASSRMFSVGGIACGFLYFVSLAGMFILRPQMALICALSMLAALFVLRFRSRFRNRTIQFCFWSSAVFVAACVAVVFVVYGNLEEFWGPELLSGISTVTSNLSYGGTTLDVPQFSTWADLLAYLPVGAVTVLFRPFLWEQGNAYIRLAGIDQLFLSAGSLLVLRGSLNRFPLVRKTGSYAATAPMDSLTVFLVVYCMVWTLFFGVIAGNLGTLVREKIQLAPFLWCAAFALNPFLRAPSRSAEASLNARGEAVLART